MNAHKLIAATTVAAAVAAAALGGTSHATAASKAGAPASGRWAGTLVQDLSLLDKPYTTPIVLGAYRGRITSIVATVRMECPGPTIDDARVAKGFRVGAGPRLNAGGDFSVALGDVRISGHLGKAGANGTARANRHGCHGRGIWKARWIGR